MSLVLSPQRFALGGLFGSEDHNCNLGDFSMIFHPARIPGKNTCFLQFVQLISQSSMISVPFHWNLLLLNVSPIWLTSNLFVNQIFRGIHISVVETNTVFVSPICCQEITNLINNQILPSLPVSRVLPQQCLGKLDQIEDTAAPLRRCEFQGFILLIHGKDVLPYQIGPWNCLELKNQSLILTEAISNKPWKNW